MSNICPSCNRLQNQPTKHCRSPTCGWRKCLYLDCKAVYDKQNRWVKL